MSKESVTRWQKRAGITLIVLGVCSGVLMALYKAGAFIPRNMRAISHDPDVIELLAKMPKDQPGEIQVANQGFEQLWDGTRLVFEAKKIGKRSRASDGTFAFDAVSDERRPIREDGLREVWVVASDGTKRKVSPPGVDAFAPLIAPNGRDIAFTARDIDSRGIAGNDILYVGDSVTGRYQTFRNPLFHGRYSGIFAAVWIDEGKTVRALQHYDSETGGDMEIKDVQLLK